MRQEGRKRGDVVGAPPAAAGASTAAPEAEAIALRRRGCRKKGPQIGHSSYLSGSETFAPVALAAVRNGQGSNSPPALGPTSPRARPEESREEVGTRETQM